MKRFKTHLALAALFVGLAIAGTMTNPHAVSGTPASSSVQFVPSVPFAVTGSGGFGQPTSITVPAGHHLIVETLSINVDVNPTGSQIQALVNYTSGGNSVSLFVPLTFSFTQPSNGFDTYVATQAVRLYADPGTTVTLGTFTPAGSVGTTFLTLSGYLN